MPSTDTSFTTVFTVPREPLDVFDAINDVRAWWDGDIDGETAELGDVFTYRHEPQHISTQRITESVPGERVAWHVDDAFLSFISDPTEWVGTTIVFDLTPTGDSGTEVRFTHRGLVPTIECFDACSSAWGYYVGESLRKFVLTTAARSTDVSPAP